MIAYVAAFALGAFFAWVIIAASWGEQWLRRREERRRGLWENCAWCGSEIRAD